MGDIHLNGGATGVEADSLSGGGASYTLSVSGITQAGEASVTVNKAGWAFTPPTKTVTVLDASKPAPLPIPDGGTNVAFTGAEADGGGGYPTTALTLDFSAGIAGFSAGGITLTPVGNANKTITKGAMEGSGPSYPLYVNGVAVEGWVDVSVNKAGYAVSGNPQRVAVHPAASVSPCCAKTKPSRNKFNSCIDLDLKCAFWGILMVFLPHPNSLSYLELTPL